jgi:hypothetical protein
VQKFVLLQIQFWCILNMMHCIKCIGIISLFCKSLSHKSLVLFHDYSHMDMTPLVWYMDVDILEDPFASRTLVATY